MMRRWSDLTVENIMKWDGWLHPAAKVANSQELIKRCLGIYTYHKSLKALLNAVMYGRLDRQSVRQAEG